MEKDPVMTHLTRLLSATALAATLATAACNRSPDATGGNAQAQMALPALPATLPLEAGAATEIAPAPSASDLPDAPPLKLARIADSGQAYGYADAAYSYDEALGDAPPDYGFDYDDTDPWAWQGYDDSLMVAEPIDDGYRYYYYRPGADEPYFVRDPFYSYGYANGLLAVVYGADGGIVPYADYGPRLIYASRYYARGGQLYGASRRGQRRSVIAANWLRQRPVIVASRDRWGAGRARQPDWRRYAEAERPRQTAYWGAEQVRRQADARRFDGWRQQGFRSAAPPRAIPVAWEKAKWAQDDRRYRPAAEALRARDDRQNADRRDDRPQADRREARQERQDDRQQQVQRDQRQAERAQAQAAHQAQGGRPARDQRRDQAQADRRGAEQAQLREARQAQRQQAEQRETRQAQQRDAQQADRARRQQADAGRQQTQQREAQQAQRQAAQAQQREPRRAEQREARQPQPQRPAAQAERRQAQQAERAQQQQAARREAQQAQRPPRQAEAREAQQAQRQQAQQAARQQQQAERQQAGQAQRQQALAAERQQAQAQRQQAQQAERQQSQQADRQRQQAEREQQQQGQRQQAQQQRQERREARGPNPR